MIKQIIYVISIFLLIVFDIAIWENVGEMMTALDTLQVILGGVIGIIGIGVNVYIIKSIIKKSIFRKEKQDEAQND